ncbi:hypothetical protein TREMEDRAFT_64307 [Tremella mesenterica DSM 1558]|uniref:uncharacterized protein n=1 Tax=Tremella mesenterica (strain ATCC 24925 / CBS 8224 / DSM 1558 / NBRC 9311 / NRRL Y-6157 / RJB 2259-6 / UBC 559-6) TaxID=578456 RepID=UPI0003F49DDB|nr:uncharacterized protein TREMEDRAFT_64307 [Tremella mesenterica DSM 1558]EIW67715.1 hypothetical protein TREMEDRAFT_64307 [Tremella mesenterica DSM 1558]
MSNPFLDGTIDLSNVDWDHLLASLNNSRQSDRMADAFGTVEPTVNPSIVQPSTMNNDNDSDISSWFDNGLSSDSSTSVVGNPSTSSVEVISVASTTPTPVVNPEVGNTHLSATTIWRHNKMDQISRFGIIRAKKCINCRDHPGRVCTQHGRNTACYHCVRLGITCNLSEEYEDEHEEHHHRYHRDPSPSPDHFYAGTHGPSNPYIAGSPLYTPISPPPNIASRQSRSPTPRVTRRRLSTHHSELPYGPSMMQLSEHLYFLKEWDAAQQIRETQDKEMRKQFIQQVHTMMGLYRRRW